MVNRLARFKLSEKEGVGVQLTSGDVRMSKEICEKSLIGRIHGRKQVNFTGLKNTMMALWCRSGTLKVIELKHGSFQFVFSAEVDRQRVLEGRPWNFENQALILHPWESGLYKRDDAFDSTRCWIQVWHVPDHWLSTETGWKVGKLFKKCFNVVIPETGSKEG